MGERGSDLVELLEPPEQVIQRFPRIPLLLRPMRAPCGSELDDLVVLQHARGELAEAGIDLGHGQFHLERLEVRDVDCAGAPQLEQFRCQHARAEVARDHRQALLAVGEGTFDDQVAQVADRVDRVPERVADGRVAGKDETAGAGIEPVADRRHRALTGNAVNRRPPRSTAAPGTSGS